MVNSSPIQDGDGEYRGVLMGEGLAETEILWTVTKDAPVDGLEWAPAAPARIAEPGRRARRSGDDLFFDSQHAT